MLSLFRRGRRINVGGGGVHVLGRRSVFIDTETTPNPHSMKFLPGTTILPETSGTGMYFQKHELKDLARSPLAKSLFSVSGVKGVFLGRDFITITKEQDEAWSALKPQLFSKMLDFLSEGKPSVLPLGGSGQGGEHVSDTAILDTDDEVVATIKELLETRVRPAVQDDGGDIFYEGFDPVTGLVKVRLAGSCVGCPSSSVTLRNGVENMLMHYIPEVKGIEEVNSDTGEQEKALSFTPQDVKSSEFVP